MLYLGIMVGSMFPFETKFFLHRYKKHIFPKVPVPSNFFKDVIENNNEVKRRGGGEGGIALPWEVLLILALVSVFLTPLPLTALFQEAFGIFGLTLSSFGCLFLFSELFSQVVRPARGTRELYHHGGERRADHQTILLKLLHCQRTLPLKQEIILALTRRPDSDSSFTKLCKKVILGDCRLEGQALRC